MEKPNMEAAKKRKRSGNWLEEDKTLLKDLVKERVSVVENKNTDTNTNIRKKKAWEDIEECFNVVCLGEKRRVQQLKSQWTLMKVQAKKDYSLHRKLMAQTGGGPKPPEMDPTAEDISVWLPNEFIVDNNEFDSDSVALGPNTPHVSESCEESMVEEYLEESHQEGEEVTDEKHKAELKSINKKKKKKKAPVSSQISLASNNIKTLTDVQLRNLEELHEIQMANERRRARNLDLEYEYIKKKFNSA